MSAFDCFLAGCEVKELGFKCFIVLFLSIIVLIAVINQVE
jgi:hypothetical protein